MEFWLKKWKQNFTLLCVVMQYVEWLYKTGYNVRWNEKWKATNSVYSVSVDVYMLELGSSLSIVTTWNTEFFSVPLVLCSVGKTAGTWGWHFTCILCQCYECMELCCHSPIHLQPSKFHFLFFVGNLKRCLFSMNDDMMNVSGRDVFCVVCCVCCRVCCVCCRVCCVECVVCVVVCVVCVVECVVCVVGCVV